MQINDRYHEALSMHRHYDVLSQSVIAAMAVVTVGTPALYQSLKAPIAGLVFFAAILLLAVALKIYESCDVHAAYALRVAGLYEEFDDPAVKPTVNGSIFHGPAHGFTRRDVYDMRGKAGGSIHSAIKRLLTAIIASFVVLGAGALYFDLKGVALFSPMSDGTTVRVQPMSKSHDAAKPGP